MEVMEDGNLMDKINILIDRDMDYYNNNQTVLQETICAGVIGGRLDFPRTVSFASMKIVLWWEEEYLAAYRKHSGFLRNERISSDSVDSEGGGSSGGCGGVVKTSDPTKFVASITKTSDQFLEHLHILTQEALDHADLTVLTSTIGASALLKNCLWCYLQASNSSDSKSYESEQLQISYKKYQEMVEALAERLLDLHCRLLSLYILQDAESLHWESEKSFFESERGSYVVQMWWLYMQGTKQDLWTTVPPKIAQRIFAGMLNETLTILTVRYSQAVPSKERSELYTVDISNLLLCIAQLLPAISANAEEFCGLSVNGKTKILRDIHAKCQELLTCFLLRAAPLDILQKAFRKGKDNLELFRSRVSGPSPWIIFAVPNIFKSVPKGQLKSFSEFPDNVIIALEIMVYLSQPEPNWALLLRVLCIKDCKILTMILKLAAAECEKSTDGNLKYNSNRVDNCGCFLCSGEGTCKGIDTSSKICRFEHYYDFMYACSVVILGVGNQRDVLDILGVIIDKSKNWYDYFDRRQVWNTKRPAWFSAVLDLIRPNLSPIISTAISAIKTGASLYQACTIIIACLSQLLTCFDPAITRMSVVLQDLLPSKINPLGNAVLFHFFISAIYTELVDQSSPHLKHITFSKDTKEPAQSKSNPSSASKQAKPSEVSSSEATLYLTLAEALCSIDEDNKHTEEINALVRQAGELLQSEEEIVGVSRGNSEPGGCERCGGSKEVLEVVTSDLLMTAVGKKSLKILDHFILNNSEWLFQNLQVSEETQTFVPNKAVLDTNKLLHIMFHIGYRSFDQLLTGKWNPEWLSLFCTPMGLGAERVWKQISKRWEFNEENLELLSSHDATIVQFVSSVLKY